MDEELDHVAISQNKKTTLYGWSKKQFLIVLLFKDH